jgi:RHS repeat-associated protein
VAARATADGELTLYLVDPLGDVCLRLNGEGRPIAYLLFDAFGQPLRGAHDDPYGYKAQYAYRTDPTGLVLCGYRYYDPYRGRFLTPDPLRQGADPYAYCAHDPVNQVDPWGLYDVEVPGYGKWSVNPNILTEEENDDHDKFVMYRGDGSGQYADWNGNVYNQQGKNIGQIPLDTLLTGLVPADIDLDANVEEAKKHKYNFIWLYNQVKNRAPWDYKQRDKSLVDFGNFHFGVVGSALGLSEEVLLRGAGWGQSRAGTSNPAYGKFWWKPPYGDDPRDQHMIRLGIRYYKQHYAPKDTKEQHSGESQPTYNRQGATPQEIVRPRYPPLMR